MAAEDDADGLQLNLVLAQDTQPRQSRTQQRKQNWRQQRAIKKQAQRQQYVGYMGPARPNWLGGGGPQQTAAPTSGGGSQMKGYSLDPPSPAVSPPAEQQPVQQRVQQRVQQPQPRAQQQQQYKQQSGDTGSAHGTRGSRKPQQQQPVESTAVEAQQKEPGRQQDVQHPPSLPVQQRKQPPQQPQKGNGVMVRETNGGGRLAVEHNQRRQQRHRGRAGSPQPGSPAPGGSSGAAAAEAKRIGKLRAASREAGYREPTPDLDDARPAGSDAESDDVAAAVAAALARDRALQSELAAPQGQPAQRYDTSSDEDEAEGGGGVRRGGGGLAAALDRFGDSSDEEGSKGRPGVVDFGGGAARDEQRRLRSKKRRQEHEAAAAAAAAQRKAPAVAVRRGELVHAGGQLPAAAAAELFGPAGGGDSGGFAALGLSPALAAHLAAHGFAAPTRVQQQAIPLLLARRDALVNAPTGSGKTLSYLAPIVDCLAAAQPRISRGQGTHALVVCPTRELCLQVADVLAMLLRRFVWLVGGAVHGGEDRGKEKARLRRGVTVLVATPGRLLDHLQNTQAFRTEELRWLVLDEADRLLDLGFEQKIGEMCAVLDARCAAADYAARRTTALLSATLHSNLGSLAAMSLREPAAVGFECDMVEGRMVVKQAQQAQQAQAEGEPAAPAAAAGRQRFSLPPQLRQSFLEVPCKLRLVALGALLRARVAAAPGTCKLVAFLATTDAVEYYHAVLAEAWEPATGEPLLSAAAVGAPLLKLHGSMPQAERTAAFLAFSKAPAGVLLCTDVAARGLDFPAVSDIVQFDPPGEASEYVHRVGRTARLGHRGNATLFLMPSEREYVEHLAAHGVRLREAAAAPILNAVLGADRKAGAELPLERHHGAYALQRQLMEAVAADRRLTRLGGDAFRSWVRAYATHAAAVKHVFHVRRLHLGHVAHAFALKERPTLVGKSSTKQAAQQKRKATHAPRGQQQQQQQQQKRKRSVAAAGGGTGGTYTLV